MALKKVLVLFSIMIFLQGCSVFTTGSVLLITSSILDPRSVITQINDKKIEFRSNMALLKDQVVVSNSRIIVNSYRGVVLLTGDALSQDIAIRAQNIVKRVNKDIKIYNEIRITKEKKLNSFLSDSFITLQIYTKLLNSNKVKLSNVKVITENSEVFLFGLVTKEEAFVVSDIARCIRGVKRVLIGFEFFKS